jgi:hypothetical protein
MGMIWNSPATKDMVNTLNYEFSNNIAKWRGVRDLFERGNQHDQNELKNIAKNNGIFGGNDELSNENDRWQFWLDQLGRSYHTTGSNHEKLRKAIFDGLDDTKYDAIYFQVVPRPHSANVKVTAYPDVDDRIMGILVETPTIDAIKNAIKAKAKKKKAKSKKKL